MTEKCTSNSAKKGMTVWFFGSLNAELDYSDGQILAKEPTSSLREVYADVRRKE